MISHAKAFSQVIQSFAPSEETVTAVRDWLVSHGIGKDRITHSDNKAWLAFDATTKEAENLLHTEYYEQEYGSHSHCPSILQRVVPMNCAFFVPPCLKVAAHADVALGTLLQASL